MKLLSVNNKKSPITARIEMDIKGKKGENGKGKNQYGESMDPIVIKVPLGTVVTDTDTNTDNNNYDERLIASKENFEKIYDLYPKKTGKAKALEYYMQWHRGRRLSGFDKAIKLTNKQMYIATMKYVAEKKDSETDLQYYKGFDVFMNKAILDYVDMDGEQT